MLQLKYHSHHMYLKATMHNLLVTQTPHLISALFYGQQMTMKHICLLEYNTSNRINNIFNKITCLLYRPVTLMLAQPEF